MDEDLVAAELAALDAVADGDDPDRGLHAYLRAYAIRRVPEAVAAAVLRQEAMDALMGINPPANRQAEPVWWLGVVAQRAGCPGWSYLPMGMEVRAKASRYRAEFRNRKIRAKAARVRTGKAVK